MPQKNIPSFSPCQLQPQAQSWPPLTLFSPSSRAPSSHSRPAVPSPWYCQVSAWQIHVKGQEAGRTVEIIRAGFPWDPRAGTPDSGSRPLQTYVSTQDTQVCLGVGVGKGVFARVPFSSKNAPSSSCSLWIWLAGPCFGLCDQAIRSKALSKHFQLIRFGVQIKPADEPKMQEPGHVWKQSQINGEKQGDRKGR